MSSNDAPAAAPEAASSKPAHILPAEHWAKQKVEEENDSDVSSSTASISESIFDYRSIHGRSFHSNKSTDAQYWTPNDNKQIEAGEIIHHLITLIRDDKLHWAPLKKDIKTVLDVGTGSGIWAIDFADQNPDANVIGTDISPTQPAWVPPNLKFEIEDATLPWTFPADHFDFIHMRYLFGSIPDWNGLLAQAYKATKPGGWVESYEASCVFRSDDGTLVEGSPMDQWGKVFVEAGKKFGRPFDVVGEGLVPEAFKAAGFVNIQTKDVKCPMNSWARDKKLQEIGAYALAAVDQDIEGWILFIWSQVMGWEKSEIEAFVVHLRRQLRDRKVHAYCLMRGVWGQKPE
ncbi:Phosphomethylethanolamine N-methyltransferase [Echria macrotheca]|uniref:Phosphomethylethanolamine N-methyltransferase n=1 Tax=Echria macrotheca TaxID=438768 RepID=A0AAJ0FC05_9PEZI|nr:Phosphomethylethanolamine N-methyltransferase [Echria macrotheca]